MGYTRGSQMDVHDNEIKRLKALRFPRTYREATGSNFYAEPKIKSSWKSWVSLLLFIVILLAVVE